MLNEVQRAEARQRVLAAESQGNARALLAAMGVLMRETPKPASDASFCSSVGLRTADLLIAQGGLRRLKTYIVRSVTLEPMLAAFRVEALLRGLWLDIQLGEYGSYLDDPINPAGALALFAPELVLIVLDAQDIAAGMVQSAGAGRAETDPDAVQAAASLVEQLVHGLRRFSRARVVLQGFQVSDVSAAGDVGEANLPWSLPTATLELNRRLAALCRTVPDCAFFDVDRVAARFGRDAFFDHRLFLATRLPVAAAAQGVYTQGLARSAAALFQAPRKVLCTDLDNTLWGGVLGEEGWNGIETGTAFPGNCYQEYQRYLKQLASRGVLLVAVSKNNPAEVEEAFLRRASDLVLTLDDFTARKIGWADKTLSLRELSVELSLGLDSFVFVDDHPVECEAMRQQLPEVATVCLPVDRPWLFAKLLGAEPFFDTLTITDADTQRTVEYRTEAQRAQLASQAGSREDFLASLGIVCTFLSVEAAPPARAVQMLGKTNQFNLTTRRHGAAEVQRFAREGEAIAVRVRDRFGDAGVVGLALVAAEDGGKCWRIDSFLISCRVIGRGVEAAMLAEIAVRGRHAGATRLIGDFIPTAKNSLCANFYPDHGFTLEPARAEDGTTMRYSLDLLTTCPAVPGWVSLEQIPEEMQIRESIPTTHPS